MSDDLDKQLQRNFHFIVNNLTQVMPVCDYLIQEQAITMHDYDNIKNQSGDVARSRMLLEILLKKPHRNKSCFIESLSKCSEDHIKESILKHNVSDQEFLSSSAQRVLMSSARTLDDWSVNDVSWWLSSLGYVSYKTREDFVKEDIDGAALKTLTITEIRSVVSPTTKAGPMLKMLDARKELLAGTSSDASSLKLDINATDNSKC